MSNYVPNYEERYYEVHPSQLRWAMHQLGSVPSYNVQGYAQGRGGMYIIVVQVPIGAEQADWRAPQPQRRRHWRIDGRQVLAWLCVLVIVGGFGYLGYTMATGGDLPTWGDVAKSLPTMPWDAQPQMQPRGEPVVEKTGWHWPWESSVVSQPQPRQSDGFQWPWDAAAKQASATIDSIGRILTIGFTVFLLAGLGFLFVKVRGAFHK